MCVVCCTVLILAHCLFHSIVFVLAINTICAPVPIITNQILYALLLLLYPLPNTCQKVTKTERRNQSRAEKSRVDAERSGEERRNTWHWLASLAGFTLAPRSKSKQSVIFKNVAQSSKNLSGYLVEMSKIAWVLYTHFVWTLQEKRRVAVAVAVAAQWSRYTHTGTQNT